MSFAHSGPALDNAGLSGVAAVVAIRAKAPRVFAVIARRKNGNVMCYELLPDQTVDAYWLHLEPSYQTPGKSQRAAWGAFDHMGYSFRQQTVENAVRVVMGQVPEHPIRVRVEQGKAHGYLTLNGQLCRLQYIYVHDDGAMWPSVDYVEVVGIDRQRREQRERIKR